MNYHCEHPLKECKMIRFITLNNQHSTWVKRCFLFFLKYTSEIMLLLVLGSIRTQMWRGINSPRLFAVKCFEMERNTTRGQDCRSVQHNGPIMGENV